MKTLDQRGDKSFSKLNRYVQLYPVPDFAKQASAADVCQPPEEKAQFFADVRHPYQFPCHSKAATFVSYMYFLENGSDLNPKVRPLVEERLDKMASYFGINNAVLALKSKHAALHEDPENSLPDSAYAIVRASDDGRKERMYPLRNALEVKAAASWFVDYLPELREALEWSDRQGVANKILNKAAEFGADVGDYLETLEKCAGRGLCDKAKAAGMIRDRVKAAYRVAPAMQEAMNKFASMIEEKPLAYFDPATMTQMAGVVDRFDRSHSLLNKYSELIPAPEDVLFEGTYSKTAEFVKDACTLTSGSVYDKQDFTKLSLQSLKDVFGDDIATSVASGYSVDPEKMAELACTFPRPDAEMFEDLLSEVDIKPMAKQAALQGVGIPVEVLRKMAEATDDCKSR
jgi:hypothetical protein